MAKTPQTIYIYRTNINDHEINFNLRIRSKIRCVRNAEADRRYGQILDGSDGESGGESNLGLLFRSPSL